MVALQNKEANEQVMLKLWSMRNIKTRAAKLNGEINISSTPGSGTTVWLKISIAWPAVHNIK